MLSPQSFHVINVLNALKTEATAVYRKWKLALFSPEFTLKLLHRSLSHFNHSYHGWHCPLCFKKKKKRWNCRMLSSTGHRIVLYFYTYTNWRRIFFKKRYWENIVRGLIKPLQPNKINCIFYQNQLKLLNLLGKPPNWNKTIVAT